MIIRLFTLIALYFATISPALGLEMVYPEDQTWISRSNFLIIKGGMQPRVDQMTVEINGTKSDLIDMSSAEYRATFGDLLILQPEFDPGKNQIAVQGYAEGKQVAETRANIYFLADPQASPPDGFRPFLLHLPEKEKICAPCHNMSPDKTALAAAGPQNPCASCHARKLNQSHVHGPAGVWSCTYCHQPDSRPSRYQPRQGDAEICNECHADKVREIRTNKFLHGPVEAGMCLICHDPHASAEIAQLPVPINRLCLSCHAQVGKGTHVLRGVSGKGHPLDRVADPSRPSRIMSCTACHNPHGGASEVYFQGGHTARFALCGSCHKK